MKTLGLFLAASLGVLLGGCYTELATTRNESEASVDTQSTDSVVQPATVLVEQIFVPVPPPRPFNPPPVVVGPAATVSPPPTSPSRDFGNTRGDTNPENNKSSGSRTTGSARGGR
jgi:hypothetical protein